MPADGKQLVERFDQLKTKRYTTESHWEDVSRFVMPDRFSLYRGTRGEQLRNQIYDDTAENSAVMLAAALHGLMVNPALEWLHYGALDEELDKRREVRRWFIECGRRVLSILGSPSSNFATASHELLLDSVIFGVGCMNERFDLPRQMRYETRPIQNTYLGGDSSRDVIEVFRYLEMSATEAISRFGAENVSPKTKKIAEGKEKLEGNIKIIHAVYKRSMYDPTRSDSKNKPWASCYIECDEKHVLGEGGFDQNPFYTPRWQLGSDEVYGRSPAMRSLPTIRLVNARAKTNITAGELTIRPPMLVPVRYMDGLVSTFPGAQIPWRGGAEKPEPLQTGARPDVGMDLIARDQAKIKENFWLDMFVIPMQDRMTATEWLGRMQQQQKMMSPVLARYYGEWLSPLAMSAFERGLRMNLFPEPPAILMGQPIQAKFVSPLAIAQKASEVQSFSQFLATVTPLIQADPAAMQNIDVRQAFKRLAASLNISPDFIVSDSEMAAMAQQQNELQSAAAQASIAKDTASAAEGGANALSTIAGMGGGV